MHAYPSIYGLGHKALDTFFAHPLVVQEKIDGSQFSFGVTLEGTLMARSKGKDLVIEHPEPMFTEAVATAVRLAPQLTPGWIYRAEYLRTPKHNTLAYGRIPAQHLMLFDVEIEPQAFLPPALLAQEAVQLGLEAVPTRYEGVLASAEQVRVLMAEESVLGNVAPEGLVLKAYGVYGSDKKTLMAKYVTEAFKERHQVEWKQSNPSRQDVVQAIVTSLKTEARWRKAIQHLRERGELTGSPKDIGPLLKEIEQDVHEEEAEAIAATLFKHAWPTIRRGVTAGFPQFYKDVLLDDAFQP